MLRCAKLLGSGKRLNGFDGVGKGLTGQRGVAQTKANQPSSMACWDCLRIDNSELINAGKGSSRVKATGESVWSANKANSSQRI